MNKPQIFPSYIGHKSVSPARTSYQLKDSAAGIFAGEIKTEQHVDALELAMIPLKKR